MKPQLNKLKEKVIAKSFQKGIEKLFRSFFPFDCTIEVKDLVFLGKKIDTEFLVKGRIQRMGKGDKDDWFSLIMKEKTPE